MLRSPIYAPPFLAIVFILILGSSLEAFACICGKASTCERFNFSSLIFVGKAVAIESSQENGLKKVDTVFEIREVFSGEKLKTVRLATDRGFSCSVTFEVGRTYLVFAGGSKTEGYGTGFCNGNMPVEYAADEIASLRKLATANAEGILHGNILRELGKGLNETEREPVKGIKISATNSGTNKVYHSQSDSEGKYEMPVPPGRYSLTAVPPKDAFVKIFEEDPVEIRSGGCSSGFFVLANDSRLTGNVVDAKGRSLRNVRVELISTDDKQRYLGGFSDDSNADGIFGFDGIPEGSYILSVNFNSQPEPSHPFPTIFYPSTNVRSEAEIIDVGPGSKIGPLTFVMPEPLAELPVVGKVVLENGSPAAGVEIKLFDQAFPGFYAGCYLEAVETRISEDSPAIAASFRMTGPACQLKSDSAGEFRLKVYSGRTYRVEASVARVIGGKKIEYKAVSSTFVADGQIAKIELELKPNTEQKP